MWPDAADLSAELGAVATLLAKTSGDNPFDEAWRRIWWDLAKKHPTYPIPAACLTATVELRGSLDVDHAQAKVDARNLVRFLMRRGVIDGVVGEPPIGKKPADPIDFLTVERIDRTKNNNHKETKGTKA